eukprot:scaffold1854_cov91-Skeletonema_dohrnii-CCMP3373.AAC.1
MDRRGGALLRVGASAGAWMETRFLDSRSSKSQPPPPMTTEEEQLANQPTLTTLLATVPSLTVMNNASSNRDESNLNDMQETMMQILRRQEEGLVGLSSVRQDIKKLLMLLALHAAS